jgi:fused signal recognition particle receptor
VIGGLWRRIKDVALTDVSVLVRGLDRDTLVEVERVLVEADFGPDAFDIVEDLERALRRGEIKTEARAREWLRDRIAALLDGADPIPLDLGDGGGPAVVLVLGVNGSGKTTTIAKLAHRLQADRKRVLLAAADTYRAGASEQLAEWARRLGVECVSGAPRSDPAAVAFAAVDAAEHRRADVLLVDTAGRLHTHGDLMEELKKIVRVLGRRRAGAPHEALLVLDGTVGQNAVNQARTFAEAVRLTGIVMTKLDGTAKGGSLVRVRREVGLPIRFIGVGERLDDLEPFEAGRFVERLLED